MIRKINKKMGLNFFLRKNFKSKNNNYIFFKFFFLIYIFGFICYFLSLDNWLKKKNYIFFLIFKIIKIYNLNFFIIYYKHLFFFKLYNFFF